MLLFLLKLCLACVLGFVLLIGVLQMPGSTVFLLAVFGFFAGLLLKASNS